MKKLLIVTTMIIISACASYTDDTKELRNDFMNGKYQASLEKLEKSPLKTSKINRLLYNAEKSIILDRLDDRKSSRNHLMRADAIADELYTTSISKTAATFVVNESVSDYEGEDYEKVAIHTMLALSYLEDNEISEARVEAKKINSRLHEITQNYDGKYAHYKEDAFARFLSGLIYESMKDWDDAIIDYRKAIEVYSSSSYSNFFEGKIPETLVTSLYSVALKRKRTDVIDDLKRSYPKILEKYDQQIRENPQGGDIVVFHEAGRIAIKVAKDFFLPVSDQVVRLSFPVIEKQTIDFQNSQSGVSVNGQYYQAANTLNMNALAYRCLEDRRGRLILKGIARLLLKGQLTYQAQKNFGILGGIAANIAGVVTETADTRSWSLLPQAFYVNRVRVSPGKHSVEFKTAGRITNVQNVNLKAGEIQLFRSKT